MHQNRYVRTPSSWLDRIRTSTAEFLNQAFQDKPQDEPKPKAVHTTSQPRINRSSTHGQGFLLVEDPSLFVQRGWIQNGDTYKGYYRTNYGAWKGEIIRRGDKYKVYVINPPITQLKKHPEKSPCVHLINSKRAEVDLHTQPKNKDVGAIILYVEKLIVESFRHYQAKPKRQSSQTDIEPFVQPIINPIRQPSPHIHTTFASHLNQEGKTDDLYTASQLFSFGLDRKARKNDSSGLQDFVARFIHDMQESKR